jgi:hypothetical protein
LTISPFSTQHHNLVLLHSACDLDVPHSLTLRCYSSYLLSLNPLNDKTYESIEGYTHFKVINI